MSDGAILAQIKGARLSLGATPLLDDATLTLARGERACLVGANGAGKSTLMRMLAGLVEPDAGEIVYAAGATLAYAAQAPDFSGFATLRDYARAPSSAQRASRAPAPAHRAEAELCAFGLDPERAPEGLSGSEGRRASLARAFAADPDILLLDEPTNHLDIPAIQALEDRLAAFTGGALIISHDRRFLERVSTTSYWLRRRRVLKHERGFAAFDDWAERVEAEEARALAKLETHLAAEEHWLRRGVTARRSRNEGRLRKLEALRAERRRRLGAAPGRAAIQAESGADSGRLVIEAKRLAKRFGARMIVTDLSLRIMRGDRVGIVGPNGAGKTTLIEMLLGRLAPDAGAVRHGVRLEIAYIDQARALLDPNATLWETLAPQGGDQVLVHGRPRHVAGYAKDFLFPPEQLRQPIRALSGGERSRAALAVALARRSNVLVLDEPTNDLDMETLDALAEMLAGYEGVALIVSHDRAFLDGIATQIVGALGDGRWAETPGGYADFEREHAPRALVHAARKPAAPAPPRRGEPRKLSYKDEHRQRELDAAIGGLQREIAALEAQLASPDAFAADPAAYNAAAERLDKARRDLDAAETEWLEIEDRRAAYSA
ncbi:MAG: ABC-F family ATP-binding cassette domain-containing protein [Hydrogenophilaceae bacterium]|jgi:ATP-binding cassette subfamily F protein uup|nr:ABC-F family ATP-binding cassette domain-containing protein [Hydrogenophilaceae bacterium]